MDVPHDGIVYAGGAKMKGNGCFVAARVSDEVGCSDVATSAAPTHHKLVPPLRAPLYEYGSTHALPPRLAREPVFSPR